MRISGAVYVSEVPSSGSEQQPLEGLPGFQQLLTLVLP
jgi:hypothetical protein